MSSYAPPIENVAIFDSALFVDGDDYITQDQADARYLRFPTAQGTETLQAINVNGDATFASGADIIQVSGSTLQQQPASQFGSLPAGTTCSLNKTFIGTNYGGTNITSLQINDTTSSSALYFIPNTSSRAYNPMVTGGDASLICTSGGLTLTRSQGGTIGFRIGSDNSVTMGSGGSTTSLPTNNIQIDSDTNLTTMSGTNLTIANTNVSLTSTTPPTSSATQPAASDSSTKIPTTAWVQSAISAGSLNIVPNSVTISANPSPSANATSGINNLWNIGAYNGLSGSTTQAYGSGWSPATIPSIQFRSNDGSNTFVMTQPCLFELTCFYYSGSSYGETTCKILIFPAATLADWGTSFLGTTTSYDINNKINGTGSFSYTNATYAPYGRQFWTYDQQFSGVAGASGWLQGSNVSAGIYQISIWLQLFNNATTWSWNIKCLNSNGATAGNMGVNFRFS